MLKNLHKIDYLGWKKKKSYSLLMWSLLPPYPHGDTDSTVHVSFIQPALFSDSTFLGA